MPPRSAHPLLTIGLSITVLGAIGAHCPHTPWGFATAPTPTAHAQVFFDSGAGVKVKLRDGAVVTGSLLVSFAPGAERLIICEYRRSPCPSVEALGARDVPLAAVRRLRVRHRATSLGADLGWRFGGIAALSHDDEDEGLIMLGMLGGAVAGGAIGSRVTRWITVAQRSDSPQLEWIPEIPMLFPLPPRGYDFVTACAPLDSLAGGAIVAVARWSKSAYFTDLRRAWDVDTSARRLIPRRTEGVRCRNAEWPSPGPGAPPALEARALTFTPSPGKARIYVYQINLPRMNGRLEILPTEFDIAIDAETVGQTGPGTYVMSEVVPGTHTTSVPQADSVVMSLDAQADHVYFVKLAYRIGPTRPVDVRLEYMKPADGRRVIPTAQMAPPNVRALP